MDIAIKPGDARAFVKMLEHEHFTYGEEGQAALRAYRVLEAAVEAKRELTVVEPPQLTQDADGYPPNGWYWFRREKKEGGYEEPEIVKIERHASHYVSVWTCGNDADETFEDCKGTFEPATRFGSNEARAAVEVRRDPADVIHECDATNLAIASDGRVYCAHCGWNDPQNALEVARVLKEITGGLKNELAHGGQVPCDPDLIDKADRALAKLNG